MQNDSLAKSPNPFNPGSPVDPADFVGRGQELENFRSKLRQTATGSLASMAVAGGYGIGKTSFLHRCRSIAEEQNALAIYFSLSELDKISKDDLARILISRIRDKVREEVILQRISDHVLDVLSRIKLSAGGGAIEIGLDAERDSHPNLQSALKAAWAAVKDSKKAIVFLIDEARALERNRAELLLYLRAVLEQLQVDRIPVMIVPAGKLSISGPPSTGFSPLVRTFPPAMLENFTNQESTTFIVKKLNQVKMRTGENALTKVHDVTEGHPYVLAAYLAAAYDKVAPNEAELTTAHFEAADVEFVNRALRPFFARFYDQTGPSSRQILTKMAENFGEASLSELTNALNKSSNELSPYLARLVQDGAIVRVDRGKYRLFHHLLGVYINQMNKDSH